MYIESKQALRELYGHPKGRARDKQLSALERHSLNFIARSPFVVIASGSACGLDASPRGGPPGFIKVLDKTHLLIPEARGNKRLDSLINIVDSGEIACLFMIPGIDETLRVNGAARVSTHQEKLSLFDDQRHTPLACIDVEVHEVFLHCAKALMRSKLWTDEARIARDTLPSMGQMINDQLAIEEPLEAQQDMLERYSEDL